MESHNIEQLAKDTQQKMSDLSVEIGYSDEEKAAKFQALAEGVVQLYNNAVKECTDYKAELQGEIDSMLSEVEEVAEDIGEIFNKVELFRD